MRDILSNLTTHRSEKENLPGYCMSSMKLTPSWDPQPYMRFLVEACKEQERSRDNQITTGQSAILPLLLWGSPQLRYASHTSRKWINTLYFHNFWLCFQRKDTHLSQKIKIEYSGNAIRICFKLKVVSFYRTVLSML